MAAVHEAESDIGSLDDSAREDFGTAAWKEYVKLWQARGYPTGRRTLREKLKEHVPSPEELYTLEQEAARRAKGDQGRGSEPPTA